MTLYRNQRSGSNFQTVKLRTIQLSTGYMIRLRVLIKQQNVFQAVHATRSSSYVMPDKWDMLQFLDRGIRGLARQ